MSKTYSSNLRDRVVAQLNHHQLKLVGLKKWRILNPPFQHGHALHARWLQTTSWKVSV